MFAHQLADEMELRLLEPYHADELFALVDANRAYLRRWLGWVDDTNTVYDIQSFIRRTRQQYANNDGVTAGIWLHGQMVGQISHNFLDWHDRKTELGYWLAAAYQGRGIMTRACRAMIDYSFTELRLNRVEILCAVGNTPSRAIPERLGFTQEGTMRQAQWLNDQWGDLVVYGLLAEEWPGIRARLGQANP